MSESDRIFTLIKSLNKPEKAYFKKFASRHVLGEKNKYAALFDAISSSKNGYDERRIKKLFHEEKFVKNFPVMKRYLFSIIMKSLNSFYSDSGPDDEVRNKIRHIEILYKKGLFMSCKKVLNSALKQAYRSDNFPGILELIRWKKNLIYENVYEGNEFINLENAHKDETEIIKKLENLSRYRMLSYRVQSLVKKTNPHFTIEAIKSELEKIKHDELLQNQEQALSYPAVIAYYHVLSLTHEALAENYEAIESRKKLINFFEQYPQKLSRNISNYLTTIFNILGPMLFLRNYGELGYYINKLKTIERSYPDRVSENDKLLIFMGALIFELRMNINTGKFSSTEQNIAEIEKGLIEFSDKIVKDDVLHFYYLLGYACFGAGKIEKALDWINKILNDKDVNRDSKLYVKARILNLVLHYELGNFELLEYLIRSTYRFLKESKLSGNDERIIINFLKRLPNISSRSQVSELFSEALHQLTSGPGSSTGDRGKNSERFEIQNSFTDSAEFDLESWLESKITGKSFEEVVSGKDMR